MVEKSCDNKFTNETILNVVEEKLEKLIKD